MGNKPKILFIDRDGTIIREPREDFQVDRLEKLEFCPRVIGSLLRIVALREYRLVMVSNQDGLGTPLFPRTDFLGPHEKMMKLLEGEGIVFDQVLIDDSLPSRGSFRRKPGTAMVEGYMNGWYDLQNSFVIGDRRTDLLFARNIGCRSIWYRQPGPPAQKFLEARRIGDGCALVSEDWSEVADYLVAGTSRRARVVRKTRETTVKCRMNLDGSGRGDISTGVGFLDHMLREWCFHSGIDLSLEVKGDRDTGPHHSVEDTAMVLGKTLRKALGRPAGIGRYGFVLPMDDSRVQVSVDISGRPWLCWEGDLSREKVGDLPTEMVRHFFKTFSDHAAITLHMSSRGNNDHHRIEALFKGLGRTLRQAVSRGESAEGIPSSKGALG